MNLRPADNNSSDLKTWEQLLAELRDLKAQNAALKKSVVKNMSMASASTANVNEELRRANRALTVLSRCKKAMIRADDEAALLNDICHIIVNEGGYRLAWIGYVENDELKTVRPVARAGEDAGYVYNLKIALNDPVRGNGPTGICLKTGKPYGSRDVRSDKEMLPWQKEALNRGYLSTLNLPIVYEKQVIGILAIYSGNADAFDNEERKLLFELAQTLAYGITAMRDRVRRVEAEKELQRSNKELEIRIDDRTAKLRESEERFRTLADNIPNLAWMANADGWIFWYNKQWYDYTGTTLEEMQGWGWQKVHHPDHVKAVTEEWSSSIKEGKPFDNIFPLRGKDGNYRWFLTRVTPIKDEQGNIQRWFGTNTDITERRNIEQALRESEERLRLAQQVARTGTFEWNIQTGMNTWTPELEAMYGLPKGGFPGTQPAWEQLVYSKDRAEAVRQVSEAIEKGEFKGEWRVVWPDGTVHWLYGRGWVFKDESGKPLKLLGINIDITERKQAEEALKLSEASLAKSQAIARLGNWEVHVKTNRVWGSDELYRMFNLEPNVTLDAYIEKMHPEDRALVVESINAAIYREKPYNIDYRIVPRPGEVRHVHAEGEVIRNKNGHPIRFFGTVQDITERKQLEKALYDAKAQAELYLDLMGHDINNMNQVGMGYLEVALETLNEEGRIEIKDVELLEKPLHAIQDSTRLIENVRKLRSAKSKKYRLQPIDLGEVLGGVKEQFSKVKGRQVTINYTPTESHILATGLVKDVFANIVGNAVNHSDADKPLEINIIQIHVHGTDESYNKVIIEDNGPGIPDELKTKIFNRFERGNTKAKGKGLGLYLVKTLVHDFGGKIWVEDRIKGDYTKGVRFVVLLPAAR